MSLARPRGIPTQPGVYRFRDGEGRVLYVGKAKNLRARLSNYFGPPASLHPRVRAMVEAASSVEWTVVEREQEALTLEYTWIKEFSPRFNVVFRDDKSYPYLALLLAEEFPRAFVWRGRHTKGNRYFGPYPNVAALRETLDLLLRVYPIRSCSDGVFRRAEAAGRACLLGYIERCSAPCIGRITPEEHHALAQELADFLGGSSSEVIGSLGAEMKQAAAELDYERAARMRDQIRALSTVLEKNTVILPASANLDVYGLAADELQASIQVFHVRNGRVTGQRGWVSDRSDDADSGRLLERLVQQVYGAGDVVIPPEILLPVLPEDVAALAAWLQQLRGGSLRVRVAQRGAKKDLARLAEVNATESLAAEKLRRGADLVSRARALEELRSYLKLEDSPLRIECYDISHTGGRNQVGSMVVFEDGLAKKRDYRTFNVQGAAGEGARDDTAAIAEVVTRRFARRAVQDASPSDSAPAAASGGEAESFAYEPGLLVIDGGAPQVEAAAAALARLGESVPVVGLAKRLEEVWLPGEQFPVILPRGSEALYLLQRVRDEAHRFAISRHRARRSRAMTDSVLDGVLGLGPRRRTALLRHFRSVKRLREATAEEIAQVKGIGPSLAEQIYRHLRRQPPS